MKFERFLSEEDKRSDIFRLRPVSLAETWSYMKSIPPKASSGTDGIPAKLLHFADTTLVRPLQIIINK